MPLVEREFQLNAPLEAVWTLLNDPNELGKSVPGCEAVTPLSENEWKWRVKFNVGVVSRRMEAIARIIEKDPQRRLSIRLDSIENDFKANLTITLESAPPFTRVNFSANVEARGPFQMIVNQMIKGQLDKLLVEFASNVSKKLSTV